MKKRFVPWFLFTTLCARVLSSQNLIQNPGFELGDIPAKENQVSFATGWNNDCGKVWRSLVPNGVPGSPDLFDSRSSNCHYDIPINKWGDREVRASGNRYVGFTGYSNSHGPAFYGETVKGTLAKSLAAGCYVISFWASAIDGVKSGGVNIPCNTPLVGQVPHPTANTIEVLLRKNNDCSKGKMVYASPSLTATVWTKFEGHFTLSAAEAAIGYNRIEFRLSQKGQENFSHAVYLDDTSLELKGLGIETNCTCPQWQWLHSDRKSCVTSAGCSVPGVPNQSLAGNYFFWEGNLYKIGSSGSSVGGFGAVKVSEGLT